MPADPLPTAVWTASGPPSAALSELVVGAGLSSAAAADLARPLAVGLALAVIAGLLGRLALGAGDEAEGWEGAIGRASEAVALGLVMLSCLGFWLGIAGRLAPGPLLALIGAIAAGLFITRRARGRSTRVPTAPAASAASAASAARPGGLAAIVGLVGLGPIVALALYPPIGFDATMYHLPFAVSFARTGHLPFLPDLRFPVLPQGAEVLFTEVFFFGGERATQFVSLVAAVATSGLLIGWGRRSGREGAGPLAAALFAGAPIVVYLAASPYVEPLLALFVTAAFARLDRVLDRTPDGSKAATACDPPDAPPSNAGRDVSILLAGLFAGGAAAVKYFGLFAVAAVGGVALALAGRERPVSARRLGRLVGLGAAGVALVALPWYARTTVLTGNPFFPLFPRIFGATPWPGPPGFAELGAGALVGKVSEILAFPWTSVAARARVGNLPPWSPLLWLALLAGIAALRKDRRVRRLLGAAAVYLSGFLILPLDARYLSPILPLLALAAALGLAALSSGVGRRARRMLAVVVLAPGWLWCLYHLDRLGPPPIGEAARDHFYAERFPGYRALRFLARTRGEAAAVYGFYAEDHAYFSSGPYLGDWVGRGDYAKVLSIGTTGEALARVLERLGRTHLLTVAIREPALPTDPTFAARFRAVYDDGRARVYEIVPAQRRRDRVRAGTDGASTGGGAWERSR